MRLFDAPHSLLSLVALLLSTSQIAQAGPLSVFKELVEKDFEKLSHDATSLQNSTHQDLKRQAAICSSSQINCGFYGQICCDKASETCGTNALNQAICVAGGSGGVATVTAVATAGSGSGTWQYYTSIWTTTGAITMTSVYSSFIPTATAQGICSPNWANGQSQCGAKCCDSGYYCFDETNGVCSPAGNGGYTTTGVVAGNPPARPTTISGVLTTITQTPTTTVPYGTPIATGQNGTLIASTSNGGGGLSGGAIAGIVIGVIAGIILLILICLCCCLKAGFDGILALLGLGKKEKRHVVEETYIDERHGRYGSAAGSGRRWYGSAAGGRPGRPPPPKKSGLGNLGAIGLGLGGLAVALGLKRRHDRKQDEKSSVGSSYYDSYYSYDSSVSGGRTRRTASRSRRSGH